MVPASETTPILLAWMFSHGGGDMGRLSVGSMPERVDQFVAARLFPLGGIVPIAKSA